MPISNKPPEQAFEAIYKLGSDIRTARRMRRIPTSVLAQRAGISRPSLTKVERGDPGTSIGIYARVLSVLGLSDNLSVAASLANDEEGAKLAPSYIPERIHRPRKKFPSKI